MSKRILSIILAAILLMAAVIPAALAETESDGSKGYYYVYTANGKGLNVRKTPGGDIVGSLRFGSKVKVDAFVDDTWALITYHYNMPGYGEGDYAAYINRRFLTKKKPDEKPTTTTAENAASNSDDALTAINEEFRNSKRVNPYQVLTRPARVSGWVTMRCAPSTDSDMLAVYKASTPLLVIRELVNWLQVEDPETGDVGFVLKGVVTE